MPQSEGTPSRQVVIIGGAGGVGKTSIVHSLKQLYSVNSSRSISIFSTGDYFSRLLCDSSNLERDQVKNIHWKKSEQKVITSIIKDVHALPNSAIYVLDTHFAANSPAGYMMGLGIKQIEQLACEIKLVRNSKKSVLVAIVLIEADISDVMRRRSDDIERLREFSAMDIIGDLEQTRLYSLFYYQAFVSELGSKSVEYLQINNENLDDSTNLIFMKLKNWGLA